MNTGMTTSRIMLACACLIALAAPVATTLRPALAARPAAGHAAAVQAPASGKPALAHRTADPIAHMAGAFIPNDPGRAGVAGGWRKLQWNYLPGAGVDAPAAWANLIADHRPGAKGVVVAVLDTGVAFRNWGRFKRSPDFTTTKFVDPCDLVDGKIRHGRCTNPYPLDREGHGTFVAGVIAESTNNHIGLAGLAYRAKIMPIRVLDANGNGASSTIAEGIRYAVTHRAQVINLSLEFSLGITSSDIPDILAAIRYAHARGVVVVAAAGNDSSEQIAYPAHAPAVISVGSTTLDRCLADYSNVGTGLDIVAPGGGADTSLLTDPDCHPGRRLPDVYQMTFGDPAQPNRFGYPGGWYGTSMSTPEVSAAAAMVIASGVIGRHPSPDQILTRLEQTAQPLGGTVPNANYGYGLLDIGAATSRKVAPGHTQPPVSPART
jgi:serine protease